MADGDKCDNPNIHDPAAACPAATGSLVADVITYKAGTARLEQAPFPGVDIQIQGTTKTANLKSGGDGTTPVASGLVPGAYNLTPQPAADQKDVYDFARSTISLTKTVVKDKTQTYHFVVPFHWIDYEVVYPDKKTFVVGIEYVLRLKKPVKDAKFETQTSGKTAAQKAELEKIPAGLYKLDLKLVYNPSWGDKQVTLDKAIDLKAVVSGFDPGTAGSIEIYDSQDLTNKLLAIAVNVAEDDTHHRGLKTSWTPSKASLKDLKSGRVMFRAVVGSSATWSDPLVVFLKEKYQVVDQTGKNVETSVVLRLSAGDVIRVYSSGGAAEITRPWNDPVARIDLPTQIHKSVTFEDDGVAARGFVTK